MSIRLISLAAAGLVAGCASLPQNEVGEVRTTQDGAFTAPQAQRGKAVYEADCLSCHPASFYEAQLGLWQGATVDELFEALSATMPAENPGSLPTSDYLDVLAYILSITGSPSGDAELTLESMVSVTIVND